MTQIPNDIIERMKKYNIWTENCPVPISRLQFLNIQYFDFENQLNSDGTIIVLDVIADQVKKIFQKLLEIKFPISKISTIDNYQGNDEKSMADNNSSAFNFRNIIDSNKYSIHSYGLAIDINPVQNPYIINTKKGIKIYPSEGYKYVDREKYAKGMITPEVVEIFYQHKLIGWGGNWQGGKDWHHFEVPRLHAEKIIKLNYRDGLEYLSAFL